MRVVKVTMALEKVTMTMVETVRPLPVSYPSLVPSPTSSCLSVAAARRNALRHALDNF